MVKHTRASNVAGRVIPECRSGSCRNERSASPESPTGRASIAHRRTVLRLLLLALTLQGCGLRQDDLASSTAQVDLSPDTSLGEMKRMLKEERPRLHKSDIKNMAYVAFAGNMIQAEFFLANDALEDLSDQSMPTRILAEPPFKGSLVGVPLGASQSQALMIAKAKYIHAQLTEYGWVRGTELFLDGDWYLHFPGGRRLELRNHRYVVGRAK